MNGQIILDPLLPMPLLWAAAALAAVAVAVALWRGLRGWWIRALAAAALLAAIANPALQEEERQPLADIVIAVVDETASQRVGARAEQTAEAVAALEASIGARSGTELRIVRLGDAPGDEGTRLMAALSEALAEEPQGRIAGVVLVTDGRVHDMERAPSTLPAPLHVLLTGEGDDWDRRLIVRNAPAFAILDEEFMLTLRIEDQGAVPPGLDLADLSIAIDGGAPMTFRVPVGEDLELPLTLQRGGMNVLQFELAEAPGELTTRNNAAVVQINGVRDRLRVLLVSGEPHAGQRTWRNLLKSDASVDLVHFTILRPPEKFDGVPVEELSLIAFPTRELFVDKIDEFDLIIFDRYSRRGILPNEYFQNIANYAMNGGALLISSGPEYGGVQSLYRSPMGSVLPGAPTARVVEQPFLPRLSEIGARHPVTEGLDGFGAGPDAEGDPTWGRWMRMVEVTPVGEATTVMTGPDDRPLLMLSRVGLGRVALLNSDHSWLWDRGFEGGGPQLELLRRLAHWMMREPELEEETLWVEPAGQTMRIIRRTLEVETPDVTVTHPDGTETVLTLTEVSPGRFEMLWEAPETGLYRLSDGLVETVIALGPSAPREFVETIATDSLLGPLAAATAGGVFRLEDGMPSLRDVRAGRPAAGRGWMGLTPREAYRTTDIRIAPLLPAWAFLLLASGLILGAWLREGRR